MAERNHHRRDFLRGRSAAAAAAEISDAAIEKRLGESASPESNRAEGRALVLSRRAMACEFEIRLNISREENDVAAGMAALDLIERLEDQLTVYRDRSEMIEINRRAADEAVAVEARLFELLELCEKIYAETGGAFDPTSAPLSRVWGFNRREGRMPSSDELEEALRRVGWGRVTLDAARRSVRFGDGGVELNVNSIGKGYALDRAGELLGGRGVGSWLLHGGRSTMLARGDNASRDERGWVVGIRDPKRPRRRLFEVRLLNEALSTSGAGTQFFEHRGQRYGHVIDPRTGWPAKEAILQATAIAPTGAEADALSTAFFVLGVEGTASFCECRKDIKAILLAMGGDERQTIPHLFNLD